MMTQRVTTLYLRQNLVAPRQAFIISSLFERLHFRSLTYAELLRQQFETTIGDEGPTATRWPTSCAETADAVQPDSETVQLLRRSRSLWSSYAVATTDPRLPAECIQLRNLLGRVPTFPTSSLLANKKSSTLQYHHSRFGLRISGISTWLAGRMQPSTQNNVP
jgi:hypothetical protein